MWNTGAFRKLESNERQKQPHVRHQRVGSHEPAFWCRVLAYGQAAAVARLGAFIAQTVIAVFMCLRKWIN